MTPCSNNHPPILHEEFWCPLCVLQEDFDELERERDKLLDLYVVSEHEEVRN